MRSPLFALGVAIVAIALVVAQDIVPTLDFFHTWQYALILAIFGWMLGVAATRPKTGLFTRIALSGALLAVTAGLASGLLGPDTLRIVRAPGTVAPIPQIGAAAFFANAGPAAIERGDAAVTVRRRDHRDIVVAPGERKFLQASVLLLGARPVAYIEATDAKGQHLTITQPTGPSFLSPILLLRDVQPIAGAAHAVDAFELPGAGREVKAVLFTAAQAAALPAVAAAPHGAAMLFAVFPGGPGQKSPAIAVGQSGDWTNAAGVRLRATLGVYPELIVASAPQPYVLALGLVLFLGGAILATLRHEKNSAPASRETGAELTDTAVSSV